MLVDHHAARQFPDPVAEPLLIFQNDLWRPSGDLLQKAGNQQEARRQIPLQGLPFPRPHLRQHPDRLIENPRQSLPEGRRILSRFRGDKHIPEAGHHRQGNRIPEPQLLLHLAKEGVIVAHQGHIQGNSTVGL